MSEKVIKIFYSYSRKDLELRNTLEDHLSALRRANKISTWHDLELEAGTEWERELQHQLDTADIILLLVSKDFLNSEYCSSTEVKRAMARHEEGTARVIPIILRHCNWNIPEVPFSKLNVLPTHAKPIMSWADPDEAFTIVAQRIRELVDQLITKPLKPPAVSLKELRECDPAKILFIKNVKDPERWAYSLDRMQQPENRTFELMWRSSSHGVELPKAGDLMILHQGAKVTHVVEFLDNKVRQTDSSFFRWVRAVWIAKNDWSQLPHQQEILGFNPNYSDGNTHSFTSPNFSTFRAAWSSLEDFQKHIFQRLTQPEALQKRQWAMEVARQRQQLEQLKETDNLTSEKGIDYTRLRDLLKTGQWKAADRETAERMLEVMSRQEQGRLQLEDMQNFPCTDLHTIDQLWVKYSNGKFGFSVQKKIWQQCRKPKEYFDLVSFGEAVGWSSRNKWLDYMELTFNLSAPEGHLPGKITCISWMFNDPSKVSLPMFERREISSTAVFFGALDLMEPLFSRLEACQI